MATVKFEKPYSLNAHSPRTVFGSAAQRLLETLMVEILNPLVLPDDHMARIKSAFATFEAEAHALDSAFGYLALRLDHIQEDLYGK